MKRLFWVAIGLGAGATAAVMSGRWAKRQAERVAPAHIAKVAVGSFAETSKRLTAAIQEGRDAAVAREAQVRAQVRSTTDRD